MTMIRKPLSLLKRSFTEDIIRTNFRKTASCHQSGADAHFPVFPAGDASSGQRGRKEKADLRAMDEELVANLVRGRFLSGIIVDESEKDADSKAENPDGNTEDGNIEESKESEAEEEQPKKNNIRVPYVNNQNGEMYQAIFTDGYELQRFDPKKRLRPVVVKFDDLEKFLVKDAKGFC